MALRHWLIKSEPVKYPWAQLVKDGRTHWDGVRNYEARNNLAAMKRGDLALYYHSNEGKEIVGVARVVAESYPDPTIDDERWLAVDFEPLQALERPVTLQEIKADPALANIALIKRGRISVVPIEKTAFTRILKKGATRLPRAKAAPRRAPAAAPCHR